MEQEPKIEKTPERIAEILRLTKLQSESLRHGLQEILGDEGLDPALRNKIGDLNIDASVIDNYLSDLMDK